MEDKQLIKKLKDLNSIKPNKHWVALTKNAMFQGEKESTSWLFISMGKPALALSTLALISIVVAGSLLYITPQYSPVAVYDNFNALVSKFVEQNESNEEAIASLEEIQLKLKEISASLENIKNIKDPGQALTMTGVVKGTAQRGSEAVERIKDANGTLSRQVLASLGEVEEISKDLEQKTSDLQIEMFESYLDTLKQEELTEKNREYLEKAIAYYNEEKISEAMIFVLKIEQ